MEAKDLNADTEGSSADQESNSPNILEYGIVLFMVLLAVIGKFLGITKPNEKSD